MRLAYNSSDPTLALVDDMPMLDDPMQHGMALIAALTMGEVFEAASLPQAGVYRSVGAKMAAAHPSPLRDLRELQGAVNAFWAPLGLGEATITLDTGCADPPSGRAPGDRGRCRASLGRSPARAAGRGL
jgi:hypothetical protein